MASTRIITKKQQRNTAPSISLYGALWRSALAKSLASSSRVSYSCFARRRGGSARQRSSGIGISVCMALIFIVTSWQYLFSSWQHIFMAAYQRIQRSAL
jgi:hypothetical protein